ncbi:MAG: hypothetical protein ABWZ99_03200 [Ilumatobacteraceae bacterium]
MARATRVAVAAALLVGAVGAGGQADAGPSGWCTFDDKTGIVRIGGAAQLGVGATKDGVLRWGEAPVSYPTWFDFTVCDGGGKFVTLDVVKRIDITAAAGSTTRGDSNWVIVYDEAFSGDGPVEGAPPSGLAHVLISVMGPGNLLLSARLGPDQPMVTVRPGGVDRDGDGQLDLRYITKPEGLHVQLGDVPGGVTFDAAAYDLPGLSVRGGGGGDVIQGSDQADSLFGLYGNDTVIGRGGDDKIWGDWGIDQLDGGAGDDEIVGAGDAEPDLVIGGADTDTCWVGSNDAQPVSCELVY